ncbi:MAG: hypothetical protein KGP28_11870 [Bdellovibrionales bacterium]|nr:hypothetical protein [Bdellovibrionales bacterium]
MSATRDSSQHATFVFSSFYEIYQKEKSKFREESSPIKGVVLTRKTTPFAINPSDQESFQKWATQEVTAGKKSLASELLELRKARKRLLFLIQELDDILKRE